MAATQFSGPVTSYGPMVDIPATTTNITAALGGTQLGGPSLFYKGLGVPDLRWLWDKEKVGGFKGVQPGWFGKLAFTSVDATPAAHATNNIFTAAHIVTGTALVLNGSSFAATASIPIIPYGNTGNAYGQSAVVTAGLTLDFGFGLATLVSGSANVTFADTSTLVPGMPLIFANVTGTNAPWLTVVQSITSSTVAVMTTQAPWSASSGSARVGTGNTWQPNEGTYALPTAFFPFLGDGPALFLDPRQGIARGLVITASSASAATTTFTVKGYDIYGVPMTEAIACVPATAVTTYGVKAWKHIVSITPNATDATYNWSVGTSDMFGFHAFSREWELTDVCWNALSMTASTGWTAGLAQGTTATASTADVRGTIQTSGLGPLGSGIGSTVSNGSQSGTAFTGVRLFMQQEVAVADIFAASPLAPATVYGMAQF